MEPGLRAANELLKQSAVQREQHIAATTVEHEALVELDRFKGEAMASIVHDIKNPLSAILAHYDFILDAYEGPANCLAALQDSQSAGQRILRLLNNLIDVAQRDKDEVR